MTRQTSPGGETAGRAFRRAVPIAISVLAAGAITAVITIVRDPVRGWANLLIDGYCLTTLGVSAIFFLATARLTSARWSAGLRRIPEALTSALPIAALLLLAVALGRHFIYPWSRPGAFEHESAIAGKVQYLRPPLVLLRMLVVLAAWILFAWIFRRASRQQDRYPGLGLALHRRLNRASAIFVPVFAVTLTCSAYDCLISLDPSWFSTMFAVYVFAGTFVQGIAAVALGAVLLWERGTMRSVIGGQQLHDLGKLLFAFSTFWGYIWTSQYLLIWYGNIPEEVTHYLSRTNGAWVYVFAANFLVNFVVPFVGLLSARAKRTPSILKGIAVVVLAGHWLDLYLIVMPSLAPGPSLPVVEVMVAAGYAALGCLLFMRGLGRAPLVPLHDPVLLGDRLLAEGHLSSASARRQPAASGSVPT